MACAPFCEVRRLCGKQPGKKVDRGDGHAHTKEHAGDHALRTTLAKCECQTGDDNRDEGQTAGDGAGEGQLQNVDGVLPGRIPLREQRCGKEETDEREDGPWPKIPTITTHACFHGTSQRISKRSGKPESSRRHAERPRSRDSDPCTPPLSAELARRRRGTLVAGSGCVRGKGSRSWFLASARPSCFLS